MGEGFTTDELREVRNLLESAGWKVDRAMLYDEEGVEGWTWTSEKGTEFSKIGDHSEPAPPPDSRGFFRAAATSLLKLGNGLVLERNDAVQADAERLEQTESDLITIIRWAERLMREGE